MHFVNIINNVSRISRRFKSTKINFENQKERNYSIQDAKTMVDYPNYFFNDTSFMSNRDITSVLDFSKLSDTKHPVTKVLDSINSTPEYGLIVLLVSKAFGLNVDLTDKKMDVNGLLPSQRKLAKITDMSRIANIIHKSILNLKFDDDANLVYGNKISLLSGDYLYAKTLNELAEIRDSRVFELMASVLRDFVECEFFGLRDKNDTLLPSKPLENQKSTQVDNFVGLEPYKPNDILGYPVAEWTIYNVLDRGSLLGKSCMCALILSGHSEEVQKLGYILGKSIALAWQAKLELEDFELGSSGKFNLVSVPIMCHLERNPHDYNEMITLKDNICVIDYEKVRKIIQKGSALTLSKNLENAHKEGAMHILEKLSGSDARSALENIIQFNSN